MNLLKMADMKQIDVIIKRHKCEKISFQWPDKVCNGILWMVLEEKRGELVRHGDELWKGSAGIQKKPGLIGNNWFSQEFDGELALLMPYIPVGIKETKKKKINLKQQILCKKNFNFEILYESPNSVAGL